MGRWGRHLIREFSEAASLETCVNRGDEASLQWLASTHPSIKHTTDLNTLLASSIDAVAIATPIDTHVDLALRALAAGKHVFVEKPLGTSVRECSRVIAAADRARRQLMVGYVFLYDEALIELHERTRDDPVRRLELVWHKHGTFKEPLVWNLLSHEVAIALWLSGSQPESHSVVEAYGSRTALDHLRIDLRLGPERMASIDIDRTVRARRKTVFATTVSGARYLWRDGSLMRAESDASWTVVHTAATQPLETEVRAFLQSICTGSETSTGGRFSCLVTSVVADIAKSLSQGRPRLASQ
jgi:predicted dehydrogenase